MSVSRIERVNTLELDFLLPWEEPTAYEALLSDMIAEHDPEGPTEKALVDRLTDIIWKRNRMRLAERALHMHSLESQVGYSDSGALGRAALLMSSRSKPTGAIRDALISSTEEDRSDSDYFSEEFADLKKAIAILESDLSPAAVEAATALLRYDTLEWWQRHIEEWEIEDDPSIRAERFLRFLTRDVSEELDRLVVSIEQRPALRLQAWGESLNPVRYAKLLAIESELDRQFEKSLGMLVRLKEIRGTDNSI